MVKRRWTDEEKKRRQTVAEIEDGVSAEDERQERRKEGEKAERRIMSWRWRGIIKSLLVSSIVIWCCWWKGPNGQLMPFRLPLPRRLLNAVNNKLLGHWTKRSVSDFFLLLCEMTRWSQPRPTSTSSFSSRFFSSRFFSSHNFTLFLLSHRRRQRQRQRQRLGITLNVLKVFVLRRRRKPIRRCQQFLVSFRWCRWPRRVGRRAVPCRVICLSVSYDPPPPLLSPSSSF